MYLLQNNKSGVGSSCNLQRQKLQNLLHQIIFWTVRLAVLKRDTHTGICALSEMVVVDLHESFIIGKVRQCQLYVVVHFAPAVAALLQCGALE